MKAKLVAVLLASSCLSTISFARSPESDATAAAPNSEKTRALASLSTAEDLGNRYLSIANDLAEIRARRKGDVCELGAYQGEILSVLKKANSYFFDKKRTTPALDSEFATSLGYKIYVKSSEFESLKSGTPSFFANLEFYGQALGVYGSMEKIILGDSGKGMIKVLKIGDNDVASWVSYPLSWKFIRNKKGSTLVFTHSVSGTEKTRSFRIVESVGAGVWGQFDGALVPGNRTKKMEMSDVGYGHIQYHSMIIDECEV